MEILKYPDPILRQKSIHVLSWTPEIDMFIYNMKMTLKATPNNTGVGLSAIQVGRPLRIIIARIGNEFRHFVNPEIIEKSGSYSIQEGCLSFGGIYDLVNRAKDIVLEYYVASGNKLIKHTEKFSEFNAVIIQHEIDHLNGVLLYDHMTSQYQKRVNKQFGVK